MMKYFKVLLYCLLLPILASGQDVVINGMVKTEGGQPIPYATIKFKQAGKGTVANQQGSFVLKMSPERQSDTIEFSSIGYVSEQMAVAKAGEKLSIILKEEVYNLPIAHVDAKGLKNIIKTAIKNIPENSLREPFSYPAFYRQYHLEEGKCVRLIEAAFEIHDRYFYNTAITSQSERLKLLEMRRSKVYEMNNGQHGNHLADLIMENSTHYRIGTVLNEKALSFFEFNRPVGENPEADTKQINYFYKNPRDEKVVKGTIWLKGENLQIHRIEESTHPNIEFSGVWARNTGGYDWIFREGRKVVQYKEVEGKMYLDSISFYYKHDLIHPTFHSVDFLVEEYFQLWCGEPDFSGGRHITEEEYKKSYDLYGKRYKYNPTFWEDYSLYQQHPLNDSLRQDLEWKLPMEEQFMKNGTN